MTTTTNTAAPVGNVLDHSLAEFDPEIAAQIDASWSVSSPRSR